MAIPALGAGIGKENIYYPIHISTMVTQALANQVQDTQED